MMIPIKNTGEPTFLSFEKSTRLIQVLIELKDDDKADGAALAIEIEKAINDFVKELRTEEFVNTIDTFLHHYETYEDLNNADSVKAIIETCPEFLATKDSKGYLPIHLATMNNSKEGLELYVPLLASVGMQHGIGGREARGGLLVRSGSNGSGTRALQYLVKQKAPIETLEALMRNDNQILSTPIFLKRDVRDYKLLHNVIMHLFDEESFDKRMDVVKFLLKLDKDVFLRKSTNNQLPLCYLLDRKVQGCKDNLRLRAMEYLLEEAICCQVSCPTVGGLFCISMGDFVINKLIDAFGSDKVWDSIERVLSSINIKSGDMPLILHQTIHHTPHFTGHALVRFPESVNHRDENGRLPIHIALEKGMIMGNDVVAMMSQVNYMNLRAVDPISNLPLFALAAKETSCDLTTIYHLIQRIPECVRLEIPLHDNKSVFQHRKKLKVTLDGVV